MKCTAPVCVPRARMVCPNITQVFFYVLLAVHLSIFVIVINQLYAQHFCFTISLFHASTCFEHHAVIIRRSKLYYTASGIITPIGGRPLHRLRDPPMMSTWCSKYVEA